MSRVFNQLTGNRTDNALVDWLVFVTGIVVLTASIAASVAGPAYGHASADAAQVRPMAEVTPS